MKYAIIIILALTGCEHTKDPNWWTTPNPGLQGGLAVMAASQPQYINCQTTTAYGFKNTRCW